MIFGMLMCPKVIVCRVSGYMMTDKLEVPRRRVRKDWYVGLHPDPVDRSHPDVQDDLLVQEAAKMNAMNRMLFPSFNYFIPCYFSIS